jgi:hypothetical protein
MQIRAQAALKRISLDFRLDTIKPSGTTAV